MYKDDIYKWIIECYNTLTPSEKKVADCLLAKKSAITTMSITDVADAADVSTATVTRFCRSIGLESFAECRLSITRTLAQEENGNHPREDMYSELQADDTVEEKSRKLYTISNNALTQTLALLDYKKISEAVDLISRANRVYCFGQGTSSSTAMDAWTRFTAVTPKFQWIGDTHAQAYTASILGKDDLVLYFSFSGSIRELVEVGQLVRKTEAKLILITRYEMSPGADYADLVLVCGANESPHQQGSIAVKLGNLFIIDILFNEFCSRNLDVVIRNKQATHEASLPMFVTKD